MKIGGVDPATLPTEVFLVLPRGEQELVFRACAVKSMDVFETLCPLPAPPGKMTRDGWVPTENDPTYTQVRAEWGQKRLGYMVMKSLEPSQIEWDTVKEDDPRTWKNWSKDLINGGLGDNECHRVLNLVLEANCLDETKLKKAREVFLLGQESKAAFSGRQAELPNTQSGAPVNA